MAAASVWAEQDEDAAQEALSELVRYSLVEWETPPLTPPPRPRGGGWGVEVNRYHLHDLARLYAATLLERR